MTSLARPAGSSLVDSTATQRSARFRHLAKPLRKSRGAVGLALLSLVVAAGWAVDLRGETILDSGTTTVSTGTDFGGNVFVGQNGSATLVVDGGLATADNAILGFNASVAGTTIITGGTFATSGGIYVGIQGTGTLAVNGGRVTSAGSGLGLVVGGRGTATISSGTWVNSLDLDVGLDGIGELVVNGGLVNSSSTALGRSIGALGTATISSGTWANSANLTIGSSGTGSFALNGGLVTSSSTSLGYAAGSSGTATITGGTWNTIDGIGVGYGGTGALVVSGGLVTSSSAALGYAPGALGTATITGGTWSVPGDLFVGVSGTGIVTMSGGRVIMAGTLLKNTVSAINLDPGGTLQIGVGGTTGSLGVAALVNNGTLILDRSDDTTFAGVISGTGVLTQQGGGTLTVTNDNVVPGAVVFERTVNVLAGGLRILASATGTLIVGGSSTGALNVSGGLVTGSDCVLGRNAGSIGSATITGGTLALTGDLAVGDVGTGTLAISSGVVRVADTLSIGGMGTVDINPGGSLQIGAGGPTGTLFGATLTNNGTLIFDTDNVTFLSTSMTGTGTLVQRGPGVLVITGTSTATGPTTVEAGVLFVEGALGASPVAVMANAQLGGSGSLAGAVNVAGAAALVTGFGVGSFATGTATLAAASVFFYDVDSTDPAVLGAAADLLVVSGDLNLDPANGSVLFLNDQAASRQPFVPFTTAFAMINYSGTWNGGLFTAGGNVLADGSIFEAYDQLWQIDYNRTSPAGLVNFTSEYLPSSRFVALTAVPEPSTYAMALAGLTCCAYSMFGRRKRA